MLAQINVILIHNIPMLHLRTHVLRFKHLVGLKMSLVRKEYSNRQLPNIIYINGKGYPKTIMNIVIIYSLIWKVRGSFIVFQTFLELHVAAFS